VTYNHEKFIRQALNSFFAQKTNFDFEVLIYDDASTDKTGEIIREFELKYPNIIKSIFQTDNQYSKGVRGLAMKYLLPNAQGDYVALCEGDDFFTDENKLQTQVDFLDKNSEYSMCFHLTRWFFENNEEDELIYPDTKKGISFNVEELLKENFINTNSVIYRRQNYKKIPSKNIFPGDWFLHLYHAKFGKIGFINKIMSAYRRYPGGIWWNSYKNPDKLLKKFGINQLFMYFELLKLYFYNKKYRKIILENINALIKQLSEVRRESRRVLIKKILIKNPREAFDFLIYYFLNKITKDI
jgi:glycosyltransferase involved in cell wall biosynthesis